MCNFCSTIIQELHLLPLGDWKNREKAVAPCSCRQNYKKDERDSRTQRDFCSKNPVSSFPSYAYFFLACIWESGNHVLWLRFSATSSHALVCCSLAFSRGQYLKESTLTQCQTRMKCSLDTKRNFLGEEEGSRILSYFWRRKLCDLNCQRNVIGTYHNDQPSLNGTRNHNHLHSRRSSWNLLIPTFLASKWFFFLVSFHAQNLKRWQCGSEHQHSWSNNKKLLEKFLWRENL